MRRAMKNINTQKEIYAKVSLFPEQEEVSDSYISNLYQSSWSMRKAWNCQSSPTHLNFHV